MKMEIQAEKVHFQMMHFSVLHNFWEVLQLFQPDPDIQDITIIPEAEDGQPGFHQSILTGEITISLSDLVWQFPQFQIKPVWKMPNPLSQLFLLKER